MDIFVSLWYHDTSKETKEAVDMTLGQRLCQLRGRAGLSQDALAERLGVSRQSVSKWETDASVPDLDKLVRLSQIFGVTLDELVKGTADAPSGSDANNQTEVPSGAKNTPPDMDGAADTLHIPQTAAAAQDTAELLRLHRQKLMGIALMAVALLATALNFALVFLAAPLFIAGVLCLVVRRRLGLAIGWTLWICALFVTRYASAISMSRLLSPGYWQPALQHGISPLVQLPQVAEYRVPFFVAVLAAVIEGDSHDATGPQRRKGGVDGSEGAFGPGHDFRVPARQAAEVEHHAVHA